LFKSQLAAGATLPPSGTVFLSVKDSDKPKTIEVARLLHEMGYALVATRGTAAAIAAASIPVRTVNKVKDGRPHVVDLLKNGEIDLVITTVTKSDRPSRLALDPYHGAGSARDLLHHDRRRSRGGRGMRHLAALEVYDLQSLHRETLASTGRHR